MFIKYNVNITPGIYQQMEGLRKSYLHEEMTKEQALDLLEAMGLPKDSPKLWVMCLKYGVLNQKGVTRYTRYIVPNEPYAMSTLRRLVYDFYNGHVPEDSKKAIKEKPIKDTVTGRTVLNEEFCINYLKMRGYMIFKLSPNLLKLQKALTPQFLLDSCEAELK